MTSGYGKLVLDGAAVLCALMAAINALRFPSRGASAFALAGAFLALGACFILYSRGTADRVVEAGAVVAGLLLVVDAAFRKRRRFPDESS